MTVFPAGPCGKKAPDLIRSGAGNERREPAPPGEVWGVPAPSRTRGPVRFGACSGDVLAWFGARPELAALLFAQRIGLQAPGFLDVAIAAYQFGVAQPALGGFHIVRVQVFADLGHVGQVIFDALAFVTAFLTVAEHVQRRAAQAAQSRQEAE